MWISSPNWACVFIRGVRQRQCCCSNSACVTRQECKAAEENMMTAQCDVIKPLDAAHKTNLVHSQIILVTGRKRGSNYTACIVDKEGNIIMEKEKILSHW